MPNQNPALSARDGLSAWQRLFGWTCVAGYVIALFMATATTITISIAALACIFLLLIGIRLMAVAFALMPKGSARVRAAATGDLPLITLLIPLYREADVLPDLVGAIDRLDYPAGRLDVKLLIEADDAETMQVAQAMQAHRRFDVIPVPPARRALNPRH